MRFLLAAVLLCPPQQGRPTPTAITGARIVVDPNTTIEKGTLVLRDGLIAAVGADVPAPADAEVIDGTGLTVYAGFIDGHTGIGLPPTKRTDEQRRIDEAEAFDFTRSALGGMEAANRKGVRPQLNAADLAAVSEADLKKWHAGGFTAAAVAVSDEYWAGHGAFLTLSGGARRSVLLRARTGAYAAFRSTGEGYPTTIMGVLAHMRQTLADARLYRDLHDRYAKKPEGRRPPVDPSLEALADLLERKPTVFWEANSDTEIARALAFGEEHGFPVVIVGGAEAFQVTDRLKARGASVVLSLKWPKEPEDRKKDADEIQEDKPPKQKEHEKARWEERVRCALALHEAGVPFCFSSQGLQPADVLEKIEKLVQRKLPVATALSALTAAPAALFGVDAQLGRLAVGRAANLTVLTAPLGDKKAKVKLVFADGVKFEVEKKKGPPEIDVAGIWRLTAKDLSGTMELKQSGADVTGTFRGPKGESEVTGRVSGKRVEMTVAGLTLEGGLKNNKLEGTFKTAEGADAEWSAARPD